MSSMIYHVLSLILLMHWLQFPLNRANPVWTGQLCDSSSNSSVFESSCIFQIPHIESLNKCFYWIKGIFSDFEYSPKVESCHTCFQNYISMSPENRTIYRSAAQQMLKYYKESVLHRSKYDCHEELPHGYFPLNFSHSAKPIPTYWYSRREIYNHLSGKYLLFRGNSLTRQLFQRIIMFIRGMKVFIEHYAHRDSIYGFDTEVDYWERCQMEMMAGHCNGSAQFWSHFRDRSVVALMRFSFSTSNTFPDDYDDYNVPNSTINAGFMHSLEGTIKQVGLDYPHWILMRRDSEQSLDLPVHLWSPRMHPALPNWATRNSVMYENRTRKFINDAHFQCGAEGKWGEPIVRVKVPLNMDCSDPVNLNVAQRLFMFLFDERR